MDQQHALDGIVLEMRRGITVLAVLSQLTEEQYGYSLIARLAGQGMEIDQGTLYPLLRRLESQGLLASEWRVEEARPRRYYRLSAAGTQATSALAHEWLGLVGTMERLLGIQPMKEMK